MMKKTNNFDLGLGFYEEGLGGFNIKKILKKVEKGVRTGVKSINKVRKKIMSPVARKILPKAVRKIGRDLDRKGINKVAAAVALTVLSGGSAGKLLGGAAKHALKNSAAAALKSGVKNYAETKATEVAVAAEVETTKKLAEAIKELPEFQQIVEKLRSEGYTDQEILAHWAESKSYYQASFIQAADTVRPMVEQAVNNSGLPNELKPFVTEKLIEDTANQGIVEAKKTVSGSGLLLAGAVVVSLMMMGNL